MIKRFSRRMTLIFACLDVGGAFAGLLLAYFFRFVVPLIELTKGPRPLGYFINPVTIVAVAAIWPAVFRFAGLYQVTRRRSALEEALAIVVANTIAVLLLSGLGFYVRTVSYSRGLVLLFWTFATAVQIALRFAARATLQNLRRRGVNIRRILVVGAGRLGRDFALKLHATPGIGYELVGFLDDDPEKLGKRVAQAKVLGTVDQLERVLEEERVQEVYTALPTRAYRRLEETLAACKKQTVDVKVIPDLLHLLSFKTSVEDFDGMPVLNLTATPLSGVNLLVKRAMDLCVSGIALLVLSPLLALIALLVKLTSPGPVLFGQERMGLDGRRFVMYKFRSMRADAEGGGPAWTTAEDQRRTPAGRLLRRFSLDELPQLWNVLKGEMSLVGPRPEQPAFVRDFRERVPEYMLRHKAKAGVTGWAQVNGLRGDTSIEKRIEYDLYYIRHWSVLFDVRIMLLTLMRAHKNAY